MKKNITIGEKYGPAMEITDQNKADAYFEKLVQHTMSWGRTREEATEIELANLGYYAGYYDYEIRERVNRLFGAEHPVFGVADPSPKQAFLTGVNMAEENDPSD